MAYSKANIASIIEKKIRKYNEFKKAWDDSREEYRLIGEMTALRKAEKTQIVKKGNTSR